MASSEVVKAKIASLGMHLLQPADGLAALERLLIAPGGIHARALVLHPLEQLTCAVDVVPFEWERFLQRYQPVPALLHEFAMGAPQRPQQRVPPTAHAKQQQQQQPALATVAADVPKLLATVLGAVRQVIDREVCGYYLGGTCQCLPGFTVVSAWAACCNPSAALTLPQTQVVHAVLHTRCACCLIDVPLCHTCVPCVHTPLNNPEHAVLHQLTKGGGGRGYRKLAHVIVLFNSYICIASGQTLLESEAAALWLVM